MASPQLTAMQALPPEEQEAVLRAAIDDKLPIPDDVRSEYSELLQALSIPNPLERPINPSPGVIEDPSLRADTMGARWTAAANKSTDPSVVAKSIADAIGPENVRVAPDTGVVIIKRPDGKEEYLNKPGGGLNVQDAIDFVGKNWGKLLAGGAAAATGVGIIPAAAATFGGHMLEEGASAAMGDDRSMPQRLAEAGTNAALDAGTAGAFRLAGSAARAVRPRVAQAVAGKADADIVSEARRAGMSLDAIQQSSKPKGNAGWIARRFPDAFVAQAEKNVSRANDFLDRALEMYGKAPDSETLGQTVRNRIEDVSDRIKTVGRGVDDQNFAAARRASGGAPVIDDGPARESMRSAFSSAVEDIDPSIVEAGDFGKTSETLMRKMFGSKPPGSGLTVAEWQNAKKVLDGAFETNRRGSYFPDRTSSQSGRLLVEIRKGLDESLRSASESVDGGTGAALSKALRESSEWRGALDDFHKSNLVGLVGKKTDPDSIYKSLRGASNSRIKNILSEMEQIPEMADVSDQVRSSLIRDSLSKVIPDGASEAESFKVLSKLKSHLTDQTISRLDTLGIDKSELISMRKALGAIVNRNPVSGSPTALGNSSIIQGLLGLGGAGAAVAGSYADSDTMRTIGGLGVAAAGARWALGKGLAPVLANPHGVGLMSKFLQTAGRRSGSGSKAGRISIEALRKLGAWAVTRPEFELEFEGPNVNENVPRSTQ